MSSASVATQDRSGPRWRGREPARYHSAQPSALGVVVDFSRRGLRLSVDSALQPGAFISLRPLNSSCLYDSPLEGVVVWSQAEPEQGRYLAGLQVFGETGPFGGRPPGEV